MSSGITATLVSNGVVDIRITIHLTTRRCHVERRYRCRAGAPPAAATDPPTIDYGATSAVALQEAASENVKSSHQFLARLHRLSWIHPTEHFFSAFTIHRCEFAHELVARFPFRIFARANAEREQRRDNPNGNVGCGDEKHNKRKPFS